MPQALGNRISICCLILRNKEVQFISSLCILSWAPDMLCSGNHMKCGNQISSGLCRMFWLKGRGAVSRESRLMEKRLGVVSSASFFLTREVLCGS